MSTSTVGNIALDLTGPTTFVHIGLHEFCAGVRGHEPVYRHEGHGDRPGFRVVSRHANVMTGCTEAARLSSARGTMLEVLRRGPGDSGSTTRQRSGMNRVASG